MFMYVCVYVNLCVLLHRACSTQASRLNIVDMAIDFANEL